ncbi:MAG TPA: hypothetical protein VNL15_03045 [Dehalococcoidia bacterium]|nr:hypothetical protein [Dehalococcoidia bacterium]
MAETKVEEYSRREVELAGWKAAVTSYRIGDRYYCKVDNVSPGAAVAKAEGASREEAESKAIAKAEERLGRTRRHPVG